MPEWGRIAEDISLATGLEADPESARPVSGGCINSAWRIEAGRERLFVKTNGPHTLDMFEAEKEGLEELAAADALRVPRPLATGATSGEAWLAMEWIDTGRAGSETEARLGEGLAALHRRTADRFGWHRDNTIGSTPQRNDWSESWLDFLTERRIGYQLSLAVGKGCPASLAGRCRRLLEQVGLFFTDYRPGPSLLHGDLWGGNWAVDTSGNPFVFDPAVYFGDREADLAMTELFGGFGAEFRAAYDSAWPVDPGYDTRRHLYNLYHVLNHANLFGGGYLGQADALIGRLLAAVTG